jgi:predicted transcriptional regulator
MVLGFMVFSLRTYWRASYAENASPRDAVHDELDKSPSRNYPRPMNIIRRTLDIDADTDARLREMADERGQDVAAVLAEAVALLDSVVDITGPDIGEDRRRLDAFRQTRAAVPLDDVKDWVASWGSANELPRPAPRKIG